MSLTLEELRTELRTKFDGLGSRLAAIEPLVAGIPLIHRSVETLREDMREVKATLIDLASLQISRGDAQVLHADVTKMEIRQDELEARLATVERILHEK